MKSKPLILLGILFFLFTGVSLKAQRETESGTSELQGKGLLVKERVYGAAIQNGKIIKGELLDDKIQQAVLLLSTDGDPMTETGMQDSIVSYYNKHKDCTKKCFYFPDGQLRKTQTYSYDQRGRLTTCIIRDIPTGTIEAVSYSYDPYGRLVWVINNIEARAMYQKRYIYDNHNNWIVRIDFQEYAPLYYIEREIQYE